MLQKIKKNVNIQAIISVIPAVLFVVFLFFMMVKTYTGEVKTTIEDTELSLAGFSSLSGTLEDVLQSNLYEKNSYINLNGLAARVLGINSLNERQKLSNGYLAAFENTVDTDKPSKSIINLSNFANNRGINFLYVLAPSAASIYDAEFAPGYSSESWKNIDAMVDTLSEAGVNVIDMNTWFEENSWHTEDVFFKTDHHWKPEAGLAAASCTMEFLNSQGSTSYNADLFNEDHWTVTVWEDLFLGSHGKRTGSTYADTDSISVFIPNFPINYTYSGLSKGTTNWIYRDNIVDLSYTYEVDYFNQNPYCIYMYADYPLRVTMNAEALNDQRILIIGDSYKMTFEYFLSTQFQEVYTIDLRYYTDGTLAEYIGELQPDIVIMCVYEGTLSNSLVYSFGVEDYLSALEKTNPSATSANLGDIAIEAQESNKNNFIVLNTNLQSGQAYTLTVDSTSYTGGEDLYIQMALQDLSTNKAVYNRYFDANSDEPQKWIFTVPENSSDVYAIYLYAGTKGHTQKVAIEVAGIELQEGIIEG